MVVGLIGSCQHGRDPSDGADMAFKVTLTNDTTQWVHAAGDSITTVVTRYKLPRDQDRRTLPPLSDYADTNYCPLFIHHTRSGEVLATHFTREPVKLWLNTCSAIQIDHPFQPKIRHFYVEGEFMVNSQSKEGPIVIQLPDSSVCTLYKGEAFISAYPEDSFPTVTFLQGTKLVITAKSSGMQYTLVPGETIGIFGGGTAFRPMTVDTAYIRDLTNRYIFSGTADIRTILRRVGRWYDVKICYQGAISNRTWTGNLGCDKNIQATVNLLNDVISDYMVCRVSHDSIYVFPRS